MVVYECCLGEHPYKHAQSYYDLVVELAAGASPPRLPKGRFSGALCELACDNGTALHGLSVKAGGRVDRIELGACEGGGERRPGAWRMAESKTEGKARDQDQTDETTKAKAAAAEPEGEAQQEKDLDGVPWRTWATAMKNGDEEKDEL